MEKEKVSRKKSIDVTNLPAAPEIPTESKPPTSPLLKINNNDPLSSLYGFKDREMSFLNSLNESIKAFESENSADVSNDAKSCEDECRDYISPLMLRTQGSVTALLATKDSLDQLDSLHRIIKQLLSAQEQNYQIRKRLKTVKTLHALKSMEIQMNSDPEKLIRSSIEEGSDFDINEIEENMANLENMIAAGTSASSKRSLSKKQRSKSIISYATIEDFALSRENDRNYPLRRQSAISDFKPKVSKWTKVKAAFKWEKTNALPMIESKSSDSVLSPNNSELARYLRVPTIPHGCSSGESIFSMSSGPRQGTPPEISSAASSADENEDEKTSRNRSFIREPYHDEDRRSHSLDGEMILGPNIMQFEKSKNKSAWSKVKGIVSNRHSRKSVKSTGSANSRDASPIDVAELLKDRTDSLSISSSNQPSPSHVGGFNLSIPENEYYGTSSGYSHNQMSSDDNETKAHDLKLWQGKKGSRKSKHIPEIESLPEGFPLESNRKSIPHPIVLNKFQDYNESDGLEGAAGSYSPDSARLNFLHKRNSNSVPNSPSRGAEFFSENDFSSGGDYSEATFKRGSKSVQQQDEIIKNYLELQKKIKTEFEAKKTEWEKMRPLVIQLNNSVPSYLTREDLSLPSTPKNIISNIALNEENLSADFKKKLDEWRTKKSQHSLKESSSKKTSPKIPLPDAKDLPEDFQKKLSEWKQMKTEGRVPPYTSQRSMHEKMKRQFSKSDSKSSSSSSSMKKSKTFEDRSEGFSKLKALVTEPATKEIVVKTSKGTMKFQGISRKFTRKLYEWEKAKGIAPESSTFALLHPEYSAILVDKKNEQDRHREKSPGLKRCLSVDSVKPVPSQADMTLSHQPSSLSLNDVENFKETSNARRIVSSLDIYTQSKDTDADEPEAMLVEIEDETLDTASNATPITQMQIPIFKFDFTNRDRRHDSGGCLRVIREIREVFENANNSILDIYKTSEVSITSIKHLTNIFKYINHSLVQLRESSKDFLSAYLDQALKLSSEIANDFEQVDNSFSELSLLEKLPNINNKNSQLKDSLINLEEFYKLKHEVSLEGFQAKQTVQNSDDNRNAVATVKVTPTFVCNSVHLNKVETPVKASSDSEMPGAKQSEAPSEEKTTKKVTRNTSTGSKRKVRLRRMGSRQSSKTESDTEDEQATSSDVTRKVKRKTSRAKKQLDSDKSFDSFQAEDEVVYIFKIKPGEKNEVMMKASDIAKSNGDETVQEASVQENFSNAIVKTKRKIFTPVDVQDGTVSATISREVESSSASDKNDNDKLSQHLVISSQPDNESHAKVLTLPPLPSPKVQRKSELAGKDLPPSIKLMIDRYNINNKLTHSSNSSGSCSPIWRSPIMDRRVRKQSEEYQQKIETTNSFSDCATAANGKVEADSSTETLIEPTKPLESKGAIPKDQKLLESGLSDSKSFPDVVTMRSDRSKPRTPLSERALRIKQAKEAFLKTPVISNDSSHSDWSYNRLSQISMGSTDSNTDNGSIMKCFSAGVLRDTFEETDDSTIADNKSSSLPRSIQGLSNDSETISESSKSSRFGLASLATKLRKVKLKRNAKEVSKMNTVPLLCRQILAVDFNASESEPKRSESSQGVGRFRRSKHDKNIKKSKSLGILDNE